MKSGKILFAIFVFIALSREGLHAFRETGDRWFFRIIVIVSLILSGLLIRSAFKPEGGLIKNTKYKKNLWHVLKIISIIGIVFFILNIGASPSKYQIEYNGLKISLDNCINENAQLIKDLEERKNYCECMAKGLADNETVVFDYSFPLVKGDFDNIIKSLKSRGLESQLDIENCLSYVTSLTLTDEMKNSIRNHFLDELKGSEWETIINIEGYCDCVMLELEKHTANEVLSGEFYETVEWMEIDSVCKEKNMINEL